MEIPITDDDMPEPLLEEFNITLTTNDTAVILLPPTASVTIRDDDSE